MQNNMYSIIAFVQFFKVCRYMHKNYFWKEKISLLRKRALKLKDRGRLLFILYLSLISNLKKIMCIIILSIKLHNFIKLIKFIFLDFIVKIVFYPKQPLPNKYYWPSAVLSTFIHRLNSFICHNLLNFYNFLQNMKDFLMRILANELVSQQLVLTTQYAC